MGTYHDNIFIDNIKKDSVKMVFELGSRDMIDAIKLYNHYKCKVYAFECNPDCLELCYRNLSECQDDNVKKNVFLIENAVSENNGDVSFFPFDLEKYNNMGSSSMLKIDFSMRNTNDPDYNRANPQKEIVVKGVRLDSFLSQNSISNIDLLCIDLQGYELNALKSLGEDLRNVKYIITECSIQCTYKNGANFVELLGYLQRYNFRYVCSNISGYNLPNLNLHGFSEFDALFVNSNI